MKSQIIQRYKSPFLERNDTLFDLNKEPTQDDVKSFVSTKSKMKILPVKVVESKSQVAKELERIERDVKNFELKMAEGKSFTSTVTQKSKSFVNTREKCSNHVLSNYKTEKILNDLQTQVDYQR